MKDAISARYRKAIPGILISLAALTALALIVDWEVFWAALQQANYRYLLAILPIYFISYLLRARAWQVILLSEPPLRQTFFAQQAGYLLNNLLPFRLGEPGRAYLLGRHKLGFWRVFSSIFVERAFDLTFGGVLFLGTLPFVVALPKARTLAALVGGMALLALAVMYAFARWQDRVLQFFERLEGCWPRFVKFIHERLRSFLTGLSALAEPGRFLAVFGWMAASWLLAIFVQYVTLKAFIPEAQLLWAAFGLSAAALGIAIPSSPGQIGVYEAAWVYALSLFGVEPGPALAYAVTIHVIYYAFTGLFGAYALFREGKSLGDLAKKISR
ncbi:MAG TPA: flippase-like domain-containing protein [Anaerolineales bacterium]|nr:flippase-like domain-containing protein [Anaerolineales bacterium]